MSLNHKRRIFRSTSPLHGLAAPGVARGVGVAALASLAVIPLGLWLLTPAGETPAGVIAAERMVADIERVAVVDGNTLRVADRVVQLGGVIPPARGERCQARDGSDFDCGAAAANALAALLGDGPVDCTLRGRAETGRPVATCSAGGAQLNRAVVAAGWARAGEAGLRGAEARARAEQRGLWSLSR